VNTAARRYLLVVGVLFAIGALLLLISVRVKMPRKVQAVVLWLGNAAAGLASGLMLLWGVVWVLRALGWLPIAPATGKG
jgi:hypothetical protein